MAHFFASESLVAQRIPYVIVRKECHLATQVASVQYPFKRGGIWSILKEKIVLDKVGS